MPACCIPRVRSMQCSRAIGPTRSGRRTRRRRFVLKKSLAGRLTKFPGMKTHATNPTAFRTNSPYAHAEKSGLTEDQAAASSSGAQQPLGRPPRKRQRMESDDPGASTRDRQPFTASALKKEEIDASEGAWDRRFRPWQPAAVKNARIKTEGYPDRATDDVGASSAQHRPQRSSQHHGVEARAFRPREQPFNGPPESDRVKSRRHPGSQSGHSMAWG